MNNNYDYLLKFILIGDSSIHIKFYNLFILLLDVGKSCLLNRYVEGKFRFEHDPTLGVEFGCKNTTLEGLALKIQIWDTVYILSYNKKQAGQ